MLILTHLDEKWQVSEFHSVFLLNPIECLFAKFYQFVQIQFIGQYKMWNTVRLSHGCAHRALNDCNKKYGREWHKERINTENNPLSLCC